MSALPQRPLGRTGLHVAALGLGAMDTPQSPEGAATLQAALDAGITFIDTARGYEGSEYLIGQVLRERGGASPDLVLASKTFGHTADSSQRDVDRSLSMLGVPHIALYQLHDIRTLAAWDEVMGDGGAMEGLRIAQYRGLIQHIGLSSHTNEVVERAIRSGEFSTVMLEYSAFHPRTAPLIDLARELNVGVIVMRPLGGSGRTSVLRQRVEAGTAGLLTPANLLRFVLSYPGVSVAIPGARYPSRIDANVAVAIADLPMSDEEREAVTAEAAALY